MSTINYTYNVIVDRFRQFAAGHFQLRRFTHGEISQADLEKEAEWPWLHVKPRAINYAPGTRSFSFEIFISDLPRDKEDKTGYQAESITDCSLIFQDLINEIYLGNMFGSDVVLTRPVNAEPFVEQYTHTLTGVTGIIELSLDYDWSACSIPASWNYNTPTDSPSEANNYLTFIKSITQQGFNVSLVNDEETPGNTYYYGTDAEGVKGWHQLIDNIGLTCETLPDCAVIISIVDDIAALQAEIALKANTADLGATAFSNDYDDLDNKPTIPAAQVNSDWNAVSGVAQILNKPTIPAAQVNSDWNATSGVAQILNKPTLTNGTVTSVGVTAGTGISVSGSPVTSSGSITVTNSAPDQVVALTAGSGIAVTGTYPNFTITNNAPSGGTVTAVTATAPMSSTGGSTPNLSMSSANGTTNGYLLSSDWLIFNGKFNTPTGTTLQYLRGDGSLANFPASSGGGASLSFYLNGSVAQGTFGGVAFKEMDRTPILGAGTDFTIAANGYIQSFITDANVPNQLEIPAGNWNFETYFSASSSGGTPSFYIELYKWDGATLSLIASNSATPEGITNGTAIDLYVSALAIPQTTLAATDRLAVRIYVTHSGRTIKLHTENSHLCQVITTFSTGVTALNGLTAQVQNFATGTSGTDFGISSATSTHTFNLPTASAANRGALSSADWTTFNNKQASGNYITALTGEATATGPGSVNTTLSNSAVIGKVLTGLNLAGGGTIADTDSILLAFGKVQNQISGLLGGVTFQGVWNASTNTPTLTSSVGTKGYYYIVNVAGSTNLNGITAWQIGDWAVFNGTTWDKVDNTDAVSSVNGFTGAVSLTTADISEVTNLYYTEARVNANTNVAANTAARHNAVTIGTANGLSLSTQALSLALASTSVTGALSSTDWTTFNNKQNALVSGTNIKTINSTTLLGSGNIAVEPTITAGTTGQYYRGDKTFQTLDKTAVGLANVDNTSDANKPISTATQTALNAKQGTITLTTTGTSGASTLVGNTLNIPQYIGGVTSVTGTAPVVSSGGTTPAISMPAATSLVNGYLSSADWTTFNNKQAALVSGTNIKTINSTSLLGSGNIAVEPTITAGTTGQYYRGDKTFQTLDKTAVGLANVDNTTDLNKPISTATQTALNAKQATLVSATNIKTINGNSILGSGDLVVGGGGGSGTVTSVAALTLGTTGTNLSSTVANGTTTPVITLNVPDASATNRGALTAANWTTFNNKQAALTLTTTGTSGAATLTGATLNIPQYSGGGGGGTAGGPHLITQPIQDYTYGLKTNSAANTTCTTATNRITLMPFVPNNDFLLPLVGAVRAFIINVTTASAVNCKIVIFSDSGGRPLTKLYEGPSMSCSSTGPKYDFNYFSGFTKGTKYWIGTMTSAVGPTLTQYSPNSMIPVTDNESGATNWFLSTTSYAYGSVPATVNPAFFIPQSINCPAVFLSIITEE
jgi:hypothetical protein